MTLFQFLALPFAITHEAVNNIYNETLSDGVTPAWYGEVKTHEWGVWVDVAFLLLLGGIPWQCYYQVLKLFSVKFAIIILLVIARIQEFKYLLPNCIK